MREAPTRLQLACKKLEGPSARLAELGRRFLCLFSIGKLGRVASLFLPEDVEGDAEEERVACAPLPPDLAYKAVL